MAMESNGFRESDPAKSGATLGKLTGSSEELGKEERNLDERTERMTDLYRSKQSQDDLPREKLGKLSSVNPDTRSSPAPGETSSELSRPTTSGFGRLGQADESLASDPGGASKQVGVVSV